MWPVLFLLHYKVISAKENSTHIENWDHGYVIWDEQWNDSLNKLA